MGKGVLFRFLKSLVASDHDRELSELREAVARHQRIFHGSHGYGYFDWDLMSRRMDWSGGYWRYLGYTDEDVDYISVSTNYYDYIHPDDVDKVRAAVDRMLKNRGRVRSPIAPVEKRAATFGRRFALIRCATKMVGCSISAVSPLMSPNRSRQNRRC